MSAHLTDLRGMVYYYICKYGKQIDMNQEINTTNSLAIFRGKEIRKKIHKNEWWFSVVDVCGALTDSIDPGAYWRKLKQRLIEEGSEVVTFCHGLTM
jgi:hypothetical protein